MGFGHKVLEIIVLDRNRTSRVNSGENGKDLGLEVRKVENIAQYFQPRYHGNSTQQKGPTHLQANSSPPVVSDTHSTSYPYKPN